MDPWGFANAGQPADGGLLSQLAGGYAPLSTGRPFTPMTGMEGSPLSQMQGPLASLARLAVQPMIQQMMGQRGLAPMGVGHDQNVYDVMRNMQFYQAQMDSMRIAAEQEESNWMRTFRGMAALAGSPWGLPQQQAARSLAEGAGFLAPYGAQFTPGLMDQLGGLRGSPTVMAWRMGLGSRYRLDPVTGQMGMSPESVGRMTNQLFETMLAPENLGDMAGVTAGDLGQLYDEMVRRGMVGGGAPLETRTLQAARQFRRQQPEAFRRTLAERGLELPEGGLGDLTAEDLDKLRLDDGVKDRLRALDTERVKRSLKDYTQAVGAVRDIFGDMGRPNAPMQELITALEALTQGAVGQIDPGRLNMMVRTTHELARLGGTSIDAALAVQQHAASRAQALGISPLHAVRAAQGAQAFGNALRATGGVATDAWGQMSADQLQQMDANLRTQAAASTQAQRMAVVMRVAERGGGFREGSNAALLERAIRNQQTEFIDAEGRTRSTMMNRQEFQDILLEGALDRGLTAGQLIGMSGQRHTNEEFIERFGIIQPTRRQMAQETQGFLSARMAEAVRQRLEDQGMERPAARRAAEQAAAAMMNRIAGMTNEEFADAETRQQMLTGVLESELGETEALEPLVRAGVGREFLEGTVEQAYGAGNRALQFGKYANFRNLQNWHRVMGQRQLLQTEKELRRGRMRAETATVLAPLGRGTPLQRMFQYLMNTDIEQANWGDLLGRAFGGVDTADIQEALRGQMTKAARAYQSFEQAQQALLEAEGPARDDALKAKEAAKETLQEELGALAEMAEARGIFTDEPLQLTDVASASRALRDLETARDDLSELQTADKARLAKFWDSDAGAAFREKSELAAQRADEMASRAILSERTMQRLGPEAVHRYRQLQDALQRKQDLARRHAGGDIARLDIGDVDVDSPEERRAVTREVDRLNQRLAEAQAYYQAAMKGGRTWMDDPEQAARYSLGLTGKEDLTPGERRRLREATEAASLAAKLTPEGVAHFKTLEGARRAMEERAEELGISAEDLEKGFGFYQTQRERVKELAKLEATQKPEVVRELMGLYGFDAEQEQQLIEKMGGDISGRTADFLQSVSRSTRNLRELAGGIATKEGGFDPAAGVVRMLGEYRQAQEKKQLDAFRRKYELQDPMAFRTFRHDAQRLSLFGVEEFGDVTAADYDRRLDLFREGVYEANKAGQAGALPSDDTQRITIIDGEVTLNKDEDRLRVSATGVEEGGNFNQ